MTTDTPKMYNEETLELWKSHLDLISNYTNLLECHENETVELVNFIDQIRKKWLQAEESEQSLRAEMERQKGEITGVEEVELLHTIIAKLQSDKVKLETSKNDLHLAIARQKIENSELKRDLTLANSEKAKLEASVDALQYEITKLRSESANLRARMAIQDQPKTSSTSQQSAALNLANAENKRLKGEVRQLKEEMQRLRNDRQRALSREPTSSSGRFIGRSASSVAHTRTSSTLSSHNSIGAHSSTMDSTVSDSGISDVGARQSRTMAVKRHIPAAQHMPGKKNVVAVPPKKVYVPMADKKPPTGRPLIKVPVQRPRAVSALATSRATLSSSASSVTPNRAISTSELTPTCSATDQSLLGPVLHSPTAETVDTIHKSRRTPHLGPID